MRAQETTAKSAKELKSVLKRSKTMKTEILVTSPPKSELHDMNSLRTFGAPILEVPEYELSELFGFPRTHFEDIDGRLEARVL